VLLVEDNPTDVFVISQILKSSSIRFATPHVVTDGAEALAAVQDAARDPAQRPGLILLDLNLPKHPGIDVLEAIRRAPSLEDVPVVVVTSSASDADRKAVDRFGAEGYFQKPTTLTEYMELGELITRIVKSRPKE
jgi:chemotaxis family two-component system response regulator Rcp1